MRILFLSQRFLLPMDTGGKIRTGRILEQLSERHAVTLISDYDKHVDAAHLEGVNRFCDRFIPVPRRRPPRSSARYWGSIFRKALSRYPVTVLNDYSRALECAVEGQLATRGFDLAICDFVQSALMFRHVREVPTILFQHNVEAEIVARLADESRNWVQRLFWWLQWRKMFAFEARTSEAFDAVIAVSERDAGIMRERYGLSNVSAISTGVDVDECRAFATTECRKSHIVFCGSMDWLPNEDAVLFFVESVLPRIRQSVPDASFAVVGRNPSRRLRRVLERQKGIELTGSVADVRPHVAEAAVCVVPLRIGGGTRMKIYEAMAMGKAVVSTGIGAEGLDVTDGENIVVRDEADSFADAAIELLGNAEKRQRIGGTARRLVQTRFSWKQVAQEFEEICSSAVARANEARAT